jgi:hypothetical protein
LAINDDEEERWELKERHVTIGLASRFVTAISIVASFALLKELIAPTSSAGLRSQ